MRRMTISLLLLALLAGTGWASSSYLTGLTAELSDALDRAEELGGGGDWARARELTVQAYARWEAAGGYLSLVLRHDELDGVSGRFCEVLALLKAQEGPEYAAANRQLIAQLGHLSEMERLNWRSVLARRAGPVWG